MLAIYSKSASISVECVYFSTGESKRGLSTLALVEFVDIFSNIAEEDTYVRGLTIHRLSK